MNIYINSPSYYTEEFGIIQDVYDMCNYISRNIDIKKYTSIIDTVGITPIIAPSQVIEQNEMKEIKYISKTYRMANIALFVDYLQYVDGDVYKKKRIILDNILSSLKCLKNKLKNSFDYDMLYSDVMLLLQDYNSNTKEPSPCVKCGYYLGE